MVSDKKIERLDNSAVKLTITVDKDTVKKEYENLVKDYARSAHIKGFRKGKVPASVLEMKFGDSLRMETSQKLLEESLKEAFEEVEEKPLPYAQPELDGELGELNTDEDFRFTVKYDVFPEIKLGSYTGHEIEEPQVQITKEDEERELKALQEQNSMVIEKDSGAVEKDNIVTIDYWEVDEEGNPVEGTRREDFVFTVGSGYNYYKIDDDIVGMEKDAEKVVEKSYPEDAETEELRGQTRKIGLKIKTIKERQLPEIDDELAQDISEKYKSLDDLKKDIRSRLKETADSHVRQQKVDALMEKVLEDSTVPVPATMVDAELENSWRNFVSRFRATDEQVMQLLAAQGKTKQELLEEWKPEAEKSLKKRLLSGKMVEAEKIEATDEEIEEHLAKQAENASMSADELKDYYQKNGMMDYLKSEIQERKLFDKVLEENTIKKGKKVKFLDLVGGNE